MSFTSVGDPSPAAVSAESIQAGERVQTRTGCGWMCPWTALSDTMWTTVPPGFSELGRRYDNPFLDFIVLLGLTSQGAVLVLTLSNFYVQL